MSIVRYLVFVDYSGQHIAHGWNRYQGIVICGPILLVENTNRFKYQCKYTTTNLSKLTTIYMYRNNDVVPCCVPFIYIRLNIYTLNIINVVICKHFWKLLLFIIAMEVSLWLKTQKSENAKMLKCIFFQRNKNGLQRWACKTDHGYTTQIPSITGKHPEFRQKKCLKKQGKLQYNEWL